MAISQKVSVTTDRKTIAPVVYAVQGDTGRQIVAEYSDFQLASGMTGVFAFTRSDGTSYSVPATIDPAANTATAEMDQALTQVGKTKGQIKITDSSGLGSTFTFYIDVQEDLSGTPTEQQYYDIQAAVEAAAEAKAEADQVLEDLGPISQINDRLTDAEEELDNKADIDGTYPSLTAGLAEQLLSSNRVVDQTPYLYRQTALGKANATRALMKKIVGGSVVWNQMLNLIPKATVSGQGVTYTNNGDGSFTITGTPTSSNTFENINYVEGQNPYMLNHVYLIDSGYRGDLNVGLRVYGFGSTINVYGSAKISKVNEKGTNGYVRFQIANLQGTDIGTIKLIPQMSDLTADFGATIADYVYSLETATAGAGVAWLKEHFPRMFSQYNAYDPGTMRSVEGVSAKETVGFNLFDRSLATVGKRIDNNGNIINQSSSQPSALSDYIRVLPNHSYYLKNVHGIGFFYSSAVFDSNKNFIGILNVSGPYLASGIVTIPANGRFLRVNFNGDYVDSASCNRSAPQRNGEYEPYVKHTYPLDSTLTLRGILLLDSDNNLYFDGDEYAADGTVTRRYGERAYQSGDESLADAITDGTNTVYKLTTPTTETAEPYTEVQVVDKDGTEQFVTTGIVPVGTYTEYPEDLVGKLDSIPNPPTAAGRYVLQATVASGKVTYAWAAE